MDFELTGEQPAFQEAGLGFAGINVKDDAGFRVCNEALRLHGGYGYCKDCPIERHLRDVRVHQISCA